jgi:hypothetical protein
MDTKQNPNTCNSLPESRYSQLELAIQSGQWLKYYSASHR